MKIWLTNSSNWIKWQFWATIICNDCTTPVFGQWRCNDFYQLFSRQNVIMLQSKTCFAGFGRITHLGEERFLGDWPRPQPKGRSHCPAIFRPLFDLQRPNLAGNLYRTEVEFCGLITPSSSSLSSGACQRRSRFHKCLPCCSVLSTPLSCRQTQIDDCCLGVKCALLPKGDHASHSIGWQPPNFAWWPK